MIDKFQSRLGQKINHTMVFKKAVKAVIDKSVMKEHMAVQVKLPLASNARESPTKRTNVSHPCNSSQSQDAHVVRIRNHYERSRQESREFQKPKYASPTPRKFVGVHCPGKLF